MDELRRGFHDRLAFLHNEVEDMAQVATRAVNDATGALLAGDTAAAAKVTVDAARLVTGSATVEREVFDLIARQAPVSRDLRLLMASLRVAHELDLCGGLAVGIARRTGQLDPLVFTEVLRSLLAESGVEASRLLAGAASAYGALDDDLAVSVLQSDEAIRSLHRRFLAALFLLPEAHLESVVELGLMARFFERITDHALEIAERVRFVVSAHDVSAHDVSAPT